MREANSICRAPSLSPSSLLSFLPRPILQGREKRCSLICQRKADLRKQNYIPRRLRAEEWLHGSGTVFGKLISSVIGKMRKELRRDTECPWIKALGNLGIGWGKLENRAGQEVLVTVALDLIQDPHEYQKELFMKTSVAVQAGLRMTSF